MHPLCHLVRKVETQCVWMTHWHMNMESRLQTESNADVINHVTNWTTSRTLEQTESKKNEWTLVVHYEEFFYNW
jgi:hypothetical protein